MGFIMTAPHRTRPLTRLGAGLLSGARTLPRRPDHRRLRSHRSTSGLAPAAAGSDANRGGPASLGTAASSAIRQIAPGGLGRLTYNGTVDVAALPQISAAAAVAAGSGHHALTVDSWFRGPRTSAASKSTTAAGPLVTTPTVIHQRAARAAPSPPARASPGHQCRDQRHPDRRGGQPVADDLRGGALISRTSLASWWLTTRSISDPHILYDNAAKRWILCLHPRPDIDDGHADDVRCRLDLGRPGEHLAPLHRDLQRRALPRRDAPRLPDGRAGPQRHPHRLEQLPAWAWVVSAISTAPSSPSRRAPRMAAWGSLPGLRHRLQHLPGDPRG